MDPNTTDSPAPSAPLSPAEFLASFTNAPTAALITSFKSQAPGGRLRIFSPDGKRAYVLRAYSGLEMVKFQKEIPANATPESRELEYQLIVSSNCTVWTSTTVDGKLDTMALRSAGAGLPQSLFVAISDLSDFMDPATVMSMSGDL